MALVDLFEWVWTDHLIILFLKIHSVFNEWSYTNISVHSFQYLQYSQLHKWKSTTLSNQSIIDVQVAFEVRKRRGWYEMNKLLSKYCLYRIFCTPVFISQFVVVSNYWWLFISKTRITPVFSIVYINSKCWCHCKLGYNYSRLCN